MSGTGKAANTGGRSSDELGWITSGTENHAAATRNSHFKPERGKGETGTVNPLWATLNHSSPLQWASRDAKKAQENAQSLRDVMAAVYQGAPHTSNRPAVSDAPDCGDPSPPLRGSQGPWGCSSGSVHRRPFVRMTLHESSGATLRLWVSTGFHLCWEHPLWGPDFLPA